MVSDLPQNMLRECQSGEHLQYR